jgi:exopolysaccharide biosynthesis polyprenyl glycosylphosphotransferase
MALTSGSRWTDAGGEPLRPVPAAGGAVARLRRRLVLVDVAATLLAWSITLTVAARGTTKVAVLAVAVALVVAATLALLYQRRLYQSRVAAVRSEEVARLTVVALLSAVVAYFVTQLLQVPVGVPASVVGAAACFLALAFGRGRFQVWLQQRRSAGSYARPVVVAGDPVGAAALVELFEDSPELGMLPVAFAGPLDGIDRLGGVPRLGGVEDVARVVLESGASGVVLCPYSVPALNEVVRDLHALGVHVHVFCGINGMHHRRLRVQPLGFQPLIYVEPMKLSKPQFVAKRIVDLTGAAAVLALTAPVLVAAMVAIKLDDGGPVFFRQRRVGRDGAPFTLLKLRTMEVDAESRLDQLAERNERTGPLFKVSDDPRVTRVGRFLRASSIDELPQVLNVLRGEMSLVGPRPALPSEVQEFDSRLNDRLHVLPGMTGLWQVEGSDKASFTVYRRLDLFYVDNWSVWLDLAILMKTGGVVWRRVRTSAVAQVSLPAPPAADDDMAAVPPLRTMGTVVAIPTPLAGGADALAAVTERAE